MRTAKLDDLLAEQWLREYKRKAIRWGKVPIQALTDDHLNNIIKMLKRDAENPYEIKNSSLRF